MSAYINPNEVKTDAAGILKVWAANPDFKLKDLTSEQFQADYHALVKAMDGLKAKDDEITPLRNERDDLATKLNGYCTRARSGIKGYFGDNSTEYELAGGTRASERKKGGPKGKTPEDPKPDA